METIKNILAFFKKIGLFIWKIIGPFVLAVWNFVKSLFSSSREILVTGAVLLGVFFVANASAGLAASEQIGWLTLAAMFTGIAKFCAVSLTVWVLGIAISFPNTVGKFINKGFDEAWEGLSPNAKLYTTLAIAGVLALVATLCFVT